MPVFISYSHADANFVDRLAARLVAAKHHIWVDRWEINLGDSLTQKIEQSLTDAAAILVVLSKTSVESDWCKRELTAGLVRELEEHKTIVMPIIVEDCSIPLFLRDKLHADFRKDPDDAFRQIDRALARLSNPASARVDTGSYVTDFSVEWKNASVPYSEETWIIRFTFVDHGPNVPYVVVSECKIYEAAGSRYESVIRSNGIMAFIREIATRVYATFISNGELTATLGDTFTQFEAWMLNDNPDDNYLVVYSYRRMGADTGMDTVLYLDNNLLMAKNHLDATVR